MGHPSRWPKILVIGAIVLGLTSLTHLSARLYSGAIAPPPEPIEVHVRCDNGQAQVLIGSTGPGVFTFHLPLRLCGTDV